MARRTSLKPGKPEEEAPLCISLVKWRARFNAQPWFTTADDYRPFASTEWTYEG